MARKAAAGAGTIRKKAVTRNGKQYEYWEARYTVGYDPGTGKQIQRFSVYWQDAERGQAEAPAGYHSH